MTATHQQRETVRRALHQVYGNVTRAERVELEAADLEGWKQQANGNASSQLRAADNMAALIAQIVREMPDHRAALIADYIAGAADTLPNGCRIVGQLENDKGERFVMADTGEDSPQRWATWQRGDDGATFWGHYFSDRRAAVADLIERASV